MSFYPFALGHFFNHGCLLGGHEIRVSQTCLYGLRCLVSLAPLPEITGTAHLLDRVDRYVSSFDGQVMLCEPTPMFVAISSSFRAIASGAASIRSFPFGQVIAEPKVLPAEAAKDNAAQLLVDRRDVGGADVAGLIDPNSPDTGGVQA